MADTARGNPVPVQRRGIEHVGDTRSAQRKSALPLALTELLGTGRLMVIPVAQLSTLNVDEEYYQRRERRTMVNSIIHAMSAGGIVPDPVKLAKRVDGSLWVVDGQQRYWAHVRMQRPLTAMVYDVTKIEDEMALFTVLNTRASIRATSRIHAWTGPTAALLRELNSKPGGFFHEQIDFGHNTGRPFSSAILAKVIAASICPSMRAYHNGIDQVLLAADGALNANPVSAGERAGATLHLIGRVFDPKHQRRMRYLVAIAFALTAREKWDKYGRIVSPTPREFTSLARYDWEKCVEGFSVKYLPTLERQIKKRWKSV